MSKDLPKMKPTNKNILSESDRELINKKFDELMAACLHINDTESIEMIKKAFNFALEAHAGCKRKSGEPFVIHPIEVATITATELKLGAVSVVSALLHDVVEDTHYTTNDIVREFNQEVAFIIDGLTKIEDVYFDKYSIQVENFKKLLRTIPQDLRILFIKIADRLHNMRTLEYMHENKQAKKASETLYVYSPLAHRLGLFPLKRELEDLSFKFLEPDNYNKIADIIQIHRQNKEYIFNKFKYSIEKKLREANIKCTIDAKQKSVYSTWKKMQRDQITFEEVYNYMAARIVFESRPDECERPQCYEIYQIITNLYPGKHDTLQDWINNPRETGYEALHSSIIGPDGEFLEIHILSSRMNEIAERGYVVNESYKDKSFSSTRLGTWIKYIEKQLSDPDVVMESILPTLSPSDIYVFTPKGQIRTLAANSTVLDFAFDIHTELGMHCIGGIVNQKLVPRNYVLSSADQVKILTDKEQKPQRGWLESVVTTKAKTTLIKLFKREEKTIVEKGREKQKLVLEKFNLNYSDPEVEEKIQQSNLYNHNIDEWFYNVGRDVISQGDLERIFKPKVFPIPAISFLFSEHQKNETGLKNLKVDPKNILVIDATDASDFIMAECCNPIRGDNVIAYQPTPNDPIVIHKSSCEVAIKLGANRGNFISKVRWKLEGNSDTSIARIELCGFDRKRMISDITILISEHLDINMRSINISSNDSIFEGTIDLCIKNIEDLKRLISKMKRIKGIKTVRRVEIPLKTNK